MELLLDGVSEQLKVNDQHIVVTRKRLLALAMSGFKGTKTIPLSSIADVKIKAATYLLSGYIQLAITVDGKQSKDTISFKASENEVAEQIACFIEQTNAGRKFHGKLLSDAAGEIAKYKQLLQAELITQADFEQLEQIITKIDVGRKPSH